MADKCTIIYFFMFGLRAPLDIKGKGRKQPYSWFSRVIESAAWIVLGVTISIGALVLSRVLGSSTVAGVVTILVAPEENLKYI